MLLSKQVRSALGPSVFPPTRHALRPLSAGSAPGNGCAIAPSSIAAGGLQPAAAAAASLALAAVAGGASGGAAPLVVCAICFKPLDDLQVCGPLMLRWGVFSRLWRNQQQCGQQAASAGSCALACDICGATVHAGCYDAMLAASRQGGPSRSVGKGSGGRSGWLPTVCLCHQWGVLVNDQVAECVRYNQSRSRADLGRVSDEAAAIAPAMGADAASCCGCRNCDCRH
jgi:hypothetical protein